MMRMFALISTYIVLGYIMFRAGYKTYLFKEDRITRIALIVFCIYMMIRIWKCY